MDYRGLDIEVCSYFYYDLESRGYFFNWRFLVFVYILEYRVNFLIGKEMFFIQVEVKCQNNFEL